LLTTGLFENKRTMTKQEYGVWVVDNQYGVKGSPFLVLGSKDTMKREFGEAAQAVIIDRVLCGVAFVCFGEPVKGVIVMPI
jgi:hypothetical protein